MKPKGVVTSLITLNLKYFILFRPNFKEDTIICSMFLGITLLFDLLSLFSIKFLFSPTSLLFPIISKIGFCFPHSILKKYLSFILH